MIDGLYINLTVGPFSFNVNWDLWEDYCAYGAVEDGGRVFIREQRRKFKPKHRQIIHYPENHPKRK